MRNEVVRARRPIVIEGRPIPRPSTPVEEVMIDRRPELLERLRRGERRGEYAAMSAITPIPGSSLFAVKVRRIREEPPAWRKPAILAGVVLALLFGLLYVVSSILAALEGAGIIGALAILGLVVAAFIACRPARAAVTVIVKVFL